jgi:hypothetical protein
MGESCKAGEVDPLFKNYTICDQNLCGEGIITPIFLCWYSIEVSDQLHVPAALTPVKVLRFASDRRLGGSQSLSKEQIDVSSAGNRTSAGQLVG